MTFDLTQVTRGQLDAQLREEWKIMVDKKRVKWINKALEEQVKYVVGLLIVLRYSYIIIAPSVIYSHMCMYVCGSRYLYCMNDMIEKT